VEGSYQFPASEKKHSTDFENIDQIPQTNISEWGCHGLMVMALGWGSVGHEFNCQQ